MTVSQIVRMRLRQAAAQVLESVTAIPGAGHGYGAVARITLIVANSGHARE